ncbi:MAG TPA: hypothetical protein VFC50_01660 [Candidatus Dormibacteraeota bacterium]|nr:hypothetical protein [Candidatus Dormibacteraeota bacterium]
MDIPGSLRASVHEASMSISRGAETADYYGEPITPPLTGDHPTFGIGYTNLFMIPGEPDPRVHRLDFKNPDLEEWAADAIIDDVTKEITATMSVAIPDKAIKFMAEWFARACEVVDEATEEPRPPFITLGLSTAFTAGQQTYGEMFVYKGLYDAMFEASGGLDPLQVIEEGDNERGFAIVSEHDLDITHEQWVAQAREDAVTVGDTPEERGGKGAAMGIIARLLVPQKALHPVLVSELFTAR